MSSNTENLKNSKRCYFKGLNYYKNEDYDKAVKAFSKVPEYNEYYAGACFYKGLIHCKNKKYKAALDEFIKVTENDEHYPEACFYKGLAHCNRDELDKAFESFKQAFDGGYYEVIETYEFISNSLYDEAVKALDEVPVYDEHYAEASFYKGLIYYRNKDYNKAVEAFSKVPEDDEYYAGACFYKGLAHCNLINQQHEALKSFKQAFDGGYYEVTETLNGFINLVIQQLSSKDTDSLFNLGFILYYLKKFPDARDVFDKVTRLNDNKEQVADSWYYIGLAYYELKKYGKTLEAFEKVITCNDNEEQVADSWYYIGLIRSECERIDFSKVRGFKNNPFQKAVELLNELLKKDSHKIPKKYELFYKRGLALQKLKKFEDARTAFNEALKINPEYSKAWYGKGNVLTELESESEAEKAFEKALYFFEQSIKRNPKNPDHWYYKGLILSKLKKDKDSIKSFEEATTLNPDYTLAWNAKGEAHLNLKEYHLAVDAFGEIANKNKNDYLAWKNKGDTYYYLGEYNNAIEVYDKATKVYDKAIEAYYNANKIYKDIIDFPENREKWPYIEALFNKSLALSQLESYDLSLRTLDEITNIFEKNARSYENDFENSCENELYKDTICLILSDAWNTKGALYFRLDVLSEAKKALKKALKFNIKNARAANNLGVVLFRYGQFDRATKAFEHAISANPDYVLGYANLAELLLDRGAVNEASEQVDSALKKIHDNYASHVHSLNGRILIAKHNYNEAVESFQKAISNNTENPLLLLWLAYVRYLCKKSEDSKQATQKSENEEASKLLLSIIADLDKAMHFCKKPVILENSLIRLCNQNLWMRLYRRNLKIYIYLCKLIDLIRLLSIPILLTLILTLILIIPRPELIIFVLLIISFISIMYKPAIEQILPDYKSNSKSNSAAKEDKLFEFALESFVKIRTSLARYEDYKRIREYTLYFMGYIYYEISDFETAKEKLKECIKLKPGKQVKQSACNLLQYIWKHKLRPGILNYWFNSPVKTWEYRVYGSLILAGIAGLLFFHPAIFPGHIIGNKVILNSFAVDIYPLSLDWSLSSIAILTLILIFISSKVRIKSLGKKVSDFLEVEVDSAPPLEFRLPPSLMQDMIEDLD